jgi:hypothetical protein
VKTKPLDAKMMAPKSVSVSSMGGKSFANGKYFANYAMILFRSQVEVLRPQKF